MYHGKSLVADGTKPGGSEVTCVMQEVKLYCKWQNLGSGLQMRLVCVTSTLWSTTVHLGVYSSTFPGPTPTHTPSTASLEDCIMWGEVSNLFGQTQFGGLPVHTLLVLWVLQPSVVWVWSYSLYIIKVIRKFSMTSGLSGNNLISICAYMCMPCLTCSTN